MARNHYNNSGSNILLGLIAGTVVGAIAAAVANSPRTQEFKEDVADAFNKASKKVSGAVHAISDSSNEFSDRFFHRHQHKPNHHLTIGAIAGGVLGLSTLLFLSSNASKGFRKTIIHSMETMREKAHPFEDIAHIAAERFGENIAPWMKKVERFLSAINENEIIHNKKHRSSESPTFDKILDWAVAAAQTYQSFKK